VFRHFRQPVDGSGLRFYPFFPEGRTPSRDGTMKTKTAILSIDNLTPESISGLSRALLALSGVKEVDFSLEREVAVIEFDPELVTIEELIRAILLKGYKVK